MLYFHITLILVESSLSIVYLLHSNQFKVRHEKSWPFGASGRVNFDGLWKFYACSTDLIRIEGRKIEMVARDDERMQRVR